MVNVVILSEVFCAVWGGEGFVEIASMNGPWLRSRLPSCTAKLHNIPDGSSKLKMSDLVFIYSFNPMKILWPLPIFSQLVGLGALMTVLVSLPADAKAVGRNIQPSSGHSAQVLERGAIALRLAEEMEETEAEGEEDNTEDRIIFLSGEITYGTANAVVSELFRLDKENPEEDIYLYIISPGGSVHAGMAIYDAIQYIDADVVTISAGFSASMAAFLLAAGTPGKRFAFPHSRVMIHKPFGFGFGEAGDLEIRASELRRMTNEFYRLMSLHTGQSIPQLRRDMERDFYMGATEAIEYGLVDQVLERKSDLRIM